jgi:CubicO group peptidase (beta-lactamase class C family)
MTLTRFLPPNGWRTRVAPTGQWHGHPVAGEVNDQNSKRLGGVAGHAGLFSTATDLARYAQWWLRRGTTPTGAVLLRSATVDTFLASTPSAGARLLGWESRRTTEYATSPYGTLPTAGAYGHTGWTGTMLWIDPARDLFVVFLTNRAYGPRVAKPFTALHEIRARVADAAVRGAPGACRAEIRPPC